MASSNVTKGRAFCTETRSRVIAVTGLAGDGGKRIRRMNVGQSERRCAFPAIFTRQGERGLGAVRLVARMPQC